MTPALRFENVTIIYPNGHCAVREISFEIAPGERLALVGESGCGKSTIAKAALGLLPVGTIVRGSIEIDGVRINGSAEKTLRALRGIRIGYVAQDPFSACDPLRRVGDHVAEAWRAHGLAPPAGAVVKKLSDLGVADAERAAGRYPHQWSGGMLQRAVIAAASVHQPPLIIADEPTSALDAELSDITLAAIQATGAAIRKIKRQISKSKNEKTVNKAGHSSGFLLFDICLLIFDFFSISQLVLPRREWR